MHIQGGRSLGIVLLGVPLMVVLTGTALQAILPRIAIWFAAWILLSLPIGIAVGHCTLSEE
jgi:hypothetical protein